jgi:hypothetical protein
VARKPSSPHVNIRDVISHQVPFLVKEEVQLGSQNIATDLPSALLGVTTANSKKVFPLSL